MKSTPPFSQNRRLIGCAVLRWLVVVSAGSAGATTEWEFHKTADGRHPNGQEQQLVWLMNRARSNPAAEAEFLAKSGDKDIESGISYFRIGLALMKLEFSVIPAKPPAAFDRRLYDASYAHSLDLIKRDADDHEGQIERIKTARFAYDRTLVNVYAFAETPIYCHAGMNIDWGGTENGMLPGRGHRNAIMSNAPTLLSNVGLALVPETNPRTEVGPLVFSGAYASAASATPDHYNRFLVGTVWDDANNNGRYDPDEGLGDVTVQPDQGDWHAVTGVAGGWAVPVTSPGSFLVRFSGGALKTPFNRTVSVGGESVLLDTKVVPGPGPGAPLALGIRPTGGNTVLLEWSGGVPPYRLQRTQSLPAGPWNDILGPTHDTKYTISISNGSEFFRVVGSHDQLGDALSR
jgi:hypothetical protein